MKTDIPETVIHTSYIPWLARVDAAKIRSNAQRLPRWRMRWKQAI
jgi:hypothetical protein